MVEVHQGQEGEQDDDSLEVNADMMVTESDGSDLKSRRRYHRRDPNTPKSSAWCQSYKTFSLRSLSGAYRGCFM